MCRVSEWLDRSDTRTTFAALIDRIKQARTDQGQGHYLCSLQGAVVEIRTEVEQTSGQAFFSGTLPVMGPEQYDQ